MGLFDFLKKVTDDNVERTTTVRYAEDAWSNSPSNAPTPPEAPAVSEAGAFRFTVQDVFTITGRGTVVTGMIEAGQVSVGDEVQLRRITGECKMVRVTGLEVFRKILDTATAGMNVGILVSDVTKSDIGRGDVLER